MKNLLLLATLILSTVNAAAAYDPFELRCLPDPYSPFILTVGDLTGEPVLIVKNVDTDKELHNFAPMPRLETNKILARVFSFLFSAIALAENVQIPDTILC